MQTPAAPDSRIAQLLDRLSKQRTLDTTRRDAFKPFDFSAWRGDVSLSETPELLEFKGEFGTELACFLPFVYWLHCVGAMRNRKILTYHGMRSFYYFLADDQYTEKHANRQHYQQYDKPFQFPNVDEHLSVKRALEAYPDFRSVFRNDVFRFDAPILVIHNKFNDEWGRGPVNFIHTTSLDNLFADLKRAFQIVYIRPGIGQISGDYSLDHNTLLPFQDRDVLYSHPEVLSFDDLVQAFQSGQHYNLLKNLLYANTFHFVSAQGGATYHCAMFSGSTLLVNHRAGLEADFAYSYGLFRHLSNPCPTLLLAKSDGELVLGAKAISRAVVLGDRAVPHTDDLGIYAQLAPKRSRFPEDWASARYASLHFARSP